MIDGVLIYFDGVFSLYNSKFSQSSETSTNLRSCHVQLFGDDFLSRMVTWRIIEPGVKDSEF